MTTTGTDILDVLRTATEGRDPEALIPLYAEDAEVTIVDRSRPPSNPTVVRGRDAIATHLRETCAADMTHQVRDEVRAGPHRPHVHCRYPTAPGCSAHRRRPRRLGADHPPDDRPGRGRMR